MESDGVVCKGMIQISQEATASNIGADGPYPDHGSTGFVPTRLHEVTSQKTEKFTATVTRFIDVRYFDKHSYMKAMPYVHRYHSFQPILCSTI